MPEPLPLLAALARCATARAHLAGAEADRFYSAGNYPARDAALRRYWREEAAAATLLGTPWPEAERLGVEPWWCSTAIPLPEAQ